VSVVKRGLLVALLALAFPSTALAGPCGLPDRAPIWVDFASLDIENVLGRPGVVAAASTGSYPARLRAKGAATVYWDMNLRQRVGLTTAPADPATIEERAHRLFVFAASQSGCATPWIALNELQGAHLETPWTPNNAQYRANVLALVRALAARGARPFLLINSDPYTGSDEAAAWWRAVAQSADLVQEDYFSGLQLYRQGSVVANRRMRAAFRASVAKFVRIGIPVTKIGLMLGFQSAVGAGGREGLQPSRAWYEVVKWQALSVRQVAAEMRLASVWSWGWGTFSEAGRDPDKPTAACVYLWARSPSLCDAPAMAGKVFKTSRTDGQLILPDGAMCTMGRNAIRLSAIARLNILVKDRDVAYTALLARLAESATQRATTKEILAAERAVIQYRFGGSRSAYRAALGKAGAPLDVARAILGDSIRRHKVGATLRISAPSGVAIGGFYESYPDLLVRTVRAVGAVPWWLGGRRTGLALSTFAPPGLFEAPAGRQTTVRTMTGRYALRPLDEARPLSSVSLPEATPAIAAALKQFARSDAVVRWSAGRQTALLTHAVCRRDDLPTTAVIDLTDYLPFLRLEG
jgi:hypothetical protein